MVRAGLLAGASLAASVILPTLAHAESDAAPADAAAPSTEAPAAPGAGLTEIVVTATKRETNLQKTPISMNVISAAVMKDRHVQSLLDLADGAIPSLRVATFEARQTALTIGIRGIVPLDANQPAREQGVGIYVDGVYLGRQHGLNAALFDVERVEVLKGPQGTLFGRNTEGGALSIVTKAPSGKFDGRVSGGVGNYGSYNGEVHLDLPEYKNISIKLDGVVQYQDATTKNPLAGQYGWNYYDRRGGRVAVRWKPTSNITDDFTYDVGRDANTPFYSQLLNYNPNGCVAGAVTASCSIPGTAFTTLSGTVASLPSQVVVNGRTRMTVADIGVPQQPSVDKTFGFANTLKWKVAPFMELRAITAWRGVTSAQWDNSGGAHRVPVYSANGAFSRYSLANLTQHQFSQELQAVGSVSNFDYAAGFFYFEESASDNAATPNSNTWTTDANGNVTGYTINSAVFTNPFASIDRASAVKSKSYAGYGQVTWSPVPAWHFTVGGRYTHDTKHGELLTFRNTFNGNTLDKSWDRFNPMATIAWDATSDLHFYGKYSTGYRAGGASSRSPTYRNFDPESVRSFEIGMKSDFWDHRARFNLAGYIMDRKNSQVDFNAVYPDPNTGTNVNVLETVNAAGTTKIRGVEADLTLKPVEGLTLTGSYAYTYTKIPPVVNPFTGITQNVYVVFTPRNAASASADYEHPIGSAGTAVRLHLDANYSQSTQTFDQFATHNDASFVVNGRLSLADIPVASGGQKFTVGIWARNLLNTDYVYRRDPSNSLPAFGTGTTGSIKGVLGDYGNFNAPRTFGVDATVRF
ncbi:TonB-dependent receptor [Novosphingobium nitrogenifigens DSM 19370]|uniref:TonB-dependent receptor n=2 Tax=Novosphingobium nitrogenifigens TaxID=378548 RepID=F1Z8J0_9SPHN|nr:TonB-dependent receptor [Novosphingobium nitrogenifigens]EGD59035.1 TonB-dependent receptor [Novosphingobium nitrogenifigens DSM 19370]